MSSTVLASTNLPPEIRVYVLALDDKKFDVRGQAAVELARMGKMAEAAVPWLVRLLGDESVADWIKNSKVGEEAAYALQQIGGDKAFLLIVSACTNSSAAVRCNAVWAFAEDKTFRLEPRAIPYVFNLTQDRDASVRKAASHRLSGVSGKDFGDDPSAWEKWYNDSKAALLPKSEL